MSRGEGFVIPGTQGTARAVKSIKRRRSCTIVRRLRKWRAEAVEWGICDVGTGWTGSRGVRNLLTSNRKRVTARSRGGHLCRKSRWVLCAGLGTGAMRYNGALAILSTGWGHRRHARHVAAAPLHYALDWVRWGPSLGGLCALMHALCQVSSLSSAACSAPAPRGFSIRLASGKPPADCPRSDESQAAFTCLAKVPS